jgi:hypothetical protein
MARKGSVDERWEEIKREMAERKRQARQYRYVMPECCKAMIDTAAISLFLSETFGDGDLETPPKWYVRVGDPESGDGFTIEEAFFCPFCAKPVPKIEKRQTDRKICVVTDGGYYCKTCEERLNCCRCLNGSFHWQPEGSTRVVPELPKWDDDWDEEDVDA